MRSLTQQLRQPSRWLFVALATLAIVPACNPDNPLPTGPPVTRAVPLPAVLGADVTNLGFETVAINGAGQVAGTLNGRAVLWTPGGGTQDLGTLGGPSSRGYAINESGHVAGSSTTATGATHAFLWTPGQGMRDLGTLPGGASSIARGMNDRGEVVGESTRPRADPLDPRMPLTHAFRWTLFLGMEDLGTLGGATSVAYAISPSGAIVGSSLTATGPEHAFLWRNGVMTDLGTLGGTQSIAYAVNPSGDIVGSSTTTAGEEHAVLWPKGGGIVDLGTLGRTRSVATGINPSGQIVGWFSGAPSSGAFLWQNGVMTELPGVLREVPGFSGEGAPHAYGINAAGEIVGDGLTDYRPHAALWTRK